MNHPVRLTRLFAASVTLAGCAVFTAPAAAATIEYSPLANPNGDWTFGWTASRGAAFTTHPDNGSQWSMNYWHDAAVDIVPFALYNGTDSTQSVIGVYNLEPGELVLHPGAGGENSVVRWTAPAGGTYEISAQFSSAYFTDGVTAATIDGAVLHNALELGSGTISQIGDVLMLDHTVALEAGDVIDFSVGLGNNGNQNSDATTLYASIEPVVHPSTGTVPVPPAVWLLGSGLLGLAGVARRRGGGAPSTTRRSV